MEDNDNNFNNSNQDVELNEKESNVKKWLINAYEMAINGIPNISEPIDELMENYTKKATSNESAIKEFIKNQILKCTISGFVTGLGGFTTLPLALTANVSSVLYVQLRMIAIIAKFYGYDIRSEKGRTLCYMCLLGNNAIGPILKEVGFKVGKKFTINAINAIPAKILMEINKKVMFRLVSKFGQKSVVNIAKLSIPLVGGIVGGAVDNISTRIIANRAIEFFKPKEN